MLNVHTIKLQLTGMTTQMVYRETQIFWLGTQA